MREKSCSTRNEALAGVTKEEKALSFCAADEIGSAGVSVHDAKNDLNKDEMQKGQTRQRS